jgi:hypothetical protein
MIKQELYKILDECLDKMCNGESIEMLSTENERELVRVPARRLPNSEEKALEIDALLPITPQRAWEMPKRWRVY